MCNVTVDIAPIIWQIAPNLILDKDDEYTSKRFLFFQDPDGLPIKMYEHQIPIYPSIHSLFLTIVTYSNSYSQLDFLHQTFAQFVGILQVDVIVLVTIFPLVLF